jgi:phosphohistidine swiveling domain-containing protein
MHEGSANQTIIWTSGLARETAPGVLSPMAASLLAYGLDQAMVGLSQDWGIPSKAKGVTGFHYGRLYLNLNVVLEIAAKMPGKTPRDVAHSMGLEETHLLEQVLGLEPDKSPRFSIKRIPSFARIFRYLIFLNRYSQNGWLVHQARLEELKERRMSECSDQQLRELFSECIRLLGEATKIHGACVNFAMVMWLIAEKRIKKHFDKQEALQIAGDLSDAIGSMASTEMGLEIRRLCIFASQQPLIREALRNNMSPAELLRIRDQGVAEEFFAAWDQFLLKFGHRGINELDVLYPRWSENPQFLLDTIRGSLSGGLQSPKELRATKEQRREATLSVIDEKMSWFSFRVFNWVRKQAQFYTTLRENVKDYWIKLLQCIRSILVVLGERRHTLNELESANDIYFFTFQEILDACDTGDWIQLGSCIAQRRTQHTDNMTVNPPPTIVGAWQPSSIHEPATKPTEAKVATLSGLPCSAGQVTAVARILTVGDLHADRLAKGEIIVTEQTDASWTPLFMNAAGLVTEIGGILSHAAVVTREIGIPAVLAVRDATKRIRDGQRISLNGTDGTVELLD